MKNTTKLKLLYALFCVIVAVDFILMLNLINRDAYGWTRIVKIAAVVVISVAAIITMFFAVRLNKQLTAENAGYNYSDIDTLKTAKRKAVSVEKIVSDSDFEILTGQTAIELNVWGKKLTVTVRGSNDDGILISEAERAALIWLITEAPYESDEVKNEVLKFINDTYESWNEDWERNESLAILPDETQLTTINISIDEDSNDETIALCGECECDVEHGISVVFENRKFSGVGSYMDFEYADSLYDRRTGEEIERNEKYDLIEKLGYADEGGVFEFYSFGGSQIDAENNPIENGKLLLNAGGYRKTLFTVSNGKLSDYYSGLAFVDTDKELKRMLGRFHTEYDLKDISYTVKTIVVNECEIPWDNYKKIRRVILSIGKDKNKTLDLVILSDELDKLKKLLSFIDNAHSITE